MEGSASQRDAFATGGRHVRGRTLDRLFMGTAGVAISRPICARARTAARLGRARADANQGNPRQALLQIGERAPFEDTAALTPAAPAGRRRGEMVDDHIAKRDARARQRRGGISRFLDGHRFGKRHPRDVDARAIAQERVQIATVAIEILDEGVVFIGRPAAAQHLHHHPVFLLHHVEDARDRAQRLGHRQQAQGVSGRGRVDDNAVVAPGRAEPRHLEQRRELVDARQRQPEQQGDVVAIEPRAAERDPLEAGSPAGQPPLERPRGIDLDPVQGAATERYPARLARQAEVERIADRRRGIGGNEEGAVARRGACDRDGGGAGRLADAPLPPHQPETRGGGLRQAE